MQLPVTMHMAQKYAVSRDNPEDVFAFFYKNFGCSRKVYNLCVDSLYRQLEAAGYQCGDDIPDPVFPKVSALKKEYHYLKEVDSQGLANSVMDFLAAWKRFRKQPSHKAYTKRALRRDGTPFLPRAERDPEVPCKGYGILFLPYRLPIPVRKEQPEAADGTPYGEYLISPEAERRREAGAAPQPARRCPYRERHPVHGDGRVRPCQHLLFLYTAGGHDAAGSSHGRGTSGRNHFSWTGLLPA